MQQLIFINRYFFPDHSATSQILSDLAFHLAQMSRTVHVVTSKQIYDNPRASLPEREIINGVLVHRLASTQFGRASLPTRAVDYFSFYVSVRRCLQGIARRGDVVVAKTDPPLVSLVAMAAARSCGAHLVNWLQDLYPEIAVQLDVPFIRGPIAATLAGLRNRSLRDAAANVVVGDAMGRKIDALGAPSARTHVIPNWCDDEEIQPLGNIENPLRRAWGLAGKFVVGYSGNLGRAHEFGTVLDAAERLRGDARFMFLMIGGGKRFEELARVVKQRGLEALFRFVPYQERKMLGYSLAAPDVHWISLNPALEGLIVPSKFYGIAAAGKPIIVIAAEDGELAQLVREYDCGAAIQSGAAEKLASTLTQLSRNSAAVAEMGARARRMLDGHFTRQKGYERWRVLLEQLH